MSREILNLEDQAVVEACVKMASDTQTFTVPGLISILGRVPKLVQNLSERLRAEYDKTETLRMQVKDLQGKLVQWDVERRGLAVMRDKFGARPKENDAEFITRIHRERIDAQAEALRLSSDLALMTERAQACTPAQSLLNEAARLEGLLIRETTENARLVAELTEVEIKITELQLQLRDAQLAMQHERTAHEQVIERSEAGLLISDLVHEAYQTAQAKGWHDTADDEDVTVIEARQALCREGLRVVRICHIAERIRRGQPPSVQDYTRIFTEMEHRLNMGGVRLVSDLMLVVTEVGEAIEAVIADLYDETIKNDGKPEGLPSELADVVIRIAHICGHMKIDLTGAIRRKLEFNRTRPHKHGKRA